MVLLKACRIKFLRKREQPMAMSRFKGCLSRCIWMLLIVPTGMGESQVHHKILYRFFLKFENEKVETASFETDGCISSTVLAHLLQSWPLERVLMRFWRSPESLFQ